MYVLGLFHIWIRFEQPFLKMLIKVDKKLVWSIRSSENTERSYFGMLKTRQGGVNILRKKRVLVLSCITEIPLKVSSGRSTKAIVSPTPMKESQDFQKWDMDGEAPQQSLLLMVRIKSLEMAIKGAENLYVIWKKLSKKDYKLHLMKI